jgi:ABC-type spermidine/putrescine transport system permease subunit II
VDVLINGLSDAAKYEYVNQSRPGIARSYWDSFGIGLMIAVLSIVLGAIWNIVMGIRERRAEQAMG